MKFRNKIYPAFLFSFQYILGYRYRQDLPFIIIISSSSSSSGSNIDLIITQLVYKIAAKSFLCRYGHDNVKKTLLRRCVIAGFQFIHVEENRTEYKLQHEAVPLYLFD